MENREVGDHWASYYFFTDPRSTVVKDLIHKLVDERAIRLILTYKSGALWTDDELHAARKLALNHYGIDPATWPKEWS